MQVDFLQPWLEEFCAVFKAKFWCLEMSILLRFWGILGVLVFGMSVSLFMSIWNGFGISGVMELQWINSPYVEVSHDHRVTSNNAFWGWLQSAALAT